MLFTVASDPTLLGESSNVHYERGKKLIWKGKIKTKLFKYIKVLSELIVLKLRLN
jgi:hypothetical protein